MNISYPRVDDATLIPIRAVVALLKRYPDLLEREDCPYSQSVREFLATVLGRGEAASIKDHYDDDELEGEIATLYSELKRAGLNVSVSDPKEKISMLKTSSDLLTKMVSLKERMVNIKQMGAFQRSVIDILESVVTPAQRSEFLERMNAYLQGTRTAVLGSADAGDAAASAGEGPSA